MAVRMARVVMIDRDPIEPRPQILFHLRHETPDQRFQILIAISVFRRDDEAELVPILATLFQESLAVRMILLSAVKRTALAPAIGAVALKILEMRDGLIDPFAAQLHDPGFDRDAALAKTGLAIPAREQPTDACTASVAMT